MLTRADFAIGRLKGPPFDPLTNSAPATAPPLPDVQCKKAQYQCDDLHPCNIFTVSTISVLTSSRLFAIRLSHRRCAMTAISYRTGMLKRHADRSVAQHSLKNYDVSMWITLVWRRGAREHRRDD
jgi:hypothetical protein